MKTITIIVVLMALLITPIFALEIEKLSPPDAKPTPIEENNNDSFNNVKPSEAPVIKDNNPSSVVEKKIQKPLTPKKLVERKVDKPVSPPKEIKKNSNADKIISPLEKTIKPVSAKPQSAPQPKPVTKPILKKPEIPMVKPTPEETPIPSVPEESTPTITNADLENSIINRIQEKVDTVNKKLAQQGINFKSLINSEIQQRKAADEKLQQDLNAEKSKRNSNDIILQRNIDKEEKSRQKSDQSILQELGIETTNRQKGDTYIYNQVQNLKNIFKVNAYAFAGFDLIVLILLIFIINKLRRINII